MRFINGLAYVSILFVTVVQRNCDGFSPSYNLGGYGNVGRIFALNPWAAMKKIFTYSPNPNQFNSPSPSFLTKETPSPDLRDLGFRNIGPVKVIRKNELLENFQPPSNESDLSSKQQTYMATFGPFRIIRKEQLLKLYKMSNDPITLTKALLRYFSKTISEKVATLNYEANKFAALRNFFSCIDESLLLTSTCGTASHTTWTPPSSTPSSSSTSTSSTSTSSTSTSSTSTSSTSTSSTSTTTATPVIVTSNKCSDLICPPGTTTATISNPTQAAELCPATATYCYAGVMGVKNMDNVVIYNLNGVIIRSDDTNAFWTTHSANGNFLCLVWVKNSATGVWQLTNLNSNANNPTITAVCNKV